MFTRLGNTALDILHTGQYLFRFTADAGSICQKGSDEMAVITVNLGRLLSCCDSEAQTHGALIMLIDSADLWAFCHAEQASLFIVGISYLQGAGKLDFGQ
ncbi:hypothetical protein UNDYM_6014 (plasmid) [Undibacterium sp. YM2]|nr:hypothetical protein UNDYM_6014 [Undibacterium sp. YM2]